MKLTLTCYLALILSILYSCTSRSGSDSSNNSASNALSNVAGDYKDLTAFKENEILVAEFSGMVKDSFGGVMTTVEEKIKKEELKKRVTID